MHSIERYGIVALLFLIVTVVAVLMWDGGKEPDAPDAAAIGAVTAPPVGPGGPVSPGDAAARERRLELVAEGRPGPLARSPREDELRAPHAGETGGEEDPALLELESTPPEPVETQSPREQLVPDDFIARASAPVARPPAAPAGRTYAVKAGDTLSEIAQRELGSSRRWQEIVAANPGLDPARLRSGTTIRLPGAAPERDGGAPVVTPREAAAPKAGATWTVGKGENLWRIAERALGDGKRWGEIAKLNPRVDPDRLLLGQVLKLPAGAAAAKPGAAPAPKPASAAPKTAANGARASEPVVAKRPEEKPRRGGKVK